MPRFQGSPPIRKHRCNHIGQSTTGVHGFGARTPSPVARHSTGSGWVACNEKSGGLGIAHSE
jgi:hypothetical protein